MERLLNGDLKIDKWCFKVSLIFVYIFWNYFYQFLFIYFRSVAIKWLERFPNPEGVP